MNISRQVAEKILEMLDSQSGYTEISRNDFARLMGCVPSQINYVITSRFTPENGYMVESRRGGGGYIRITRIDRSKDNTLMHIINSIGEALDFASAAILCENMLYSETIDKSTALLLTSAINDKALRKVLPGNRDILRADIFKQMLITLMV